MSLQQKAGEGSAGCRKDGSTSPALQPAPAICRPRSQSPALREQSSALIKYLLHRRNNTQFPKQLQSMWESGHLWGRYCMCREGTAGSTESQVLSVPKSGFRTWIDLQMWWDPLVGVKWRDMGISLPCLFLDMKGKSCTFPLLPVLALCILLLARTWTQIQNAAKEENRVRVHHSTSEKGEAEFVFFFILLLKDAYSHGTRELQKVIGRECLTL